jgi:hypothetical protein
MDRFLLAQKDYLFADLWALCGLTQAPIHPSAWKKNSRKSICRSCIELPHWPTNRRRRLPAQTFLTTTSSGDR